MAARRGRGTIYKMIATVPGDKAFPTAAESGCPLTK
jgi:branched-chain amino acid transport system substrate-binding protein